MQLLIFCLFVVANISDNGKASIDSFVPADANILLEDTTKTSDKSCHRPCKFNVKPRRCHYKFRVGPQVNDDGKTVISINDIVPGPFINVCVNDIVVVEVTNKVPDQSLAIHWHGVEQKGTPYMDGVPMITQCPIEYGSTYKYAFRASSPGTFFYHADAVSHQTDGVYGALVVHQPSPLEPHSSLYDYDRSHEATFLISAEFPELLTGSLEDMSRARPTAMKINGLEDFKMSVIAGFAYRLRLINAVGVECPVIVSIDDHEMTVIATDGRPVKPAATAHVKLYPGERLDVVVRASQQPGGFWVRAAGLDSCAGLQASSMLLYSGFNYTSMHFQNKKDQDSNEELIPQSVISGQVLKSAIEVPHNESAVKSMYLGIDRNVVKFKDTDVDFRYISDAIPKKPFFPASLALHQNGVVQINGKNFLYPNEPLLLRPHQVKPELICHVGEEHQHQEPQCLQVVNVENTDVIELALVNEGAGSKESYTFHLHGHGMQVVATGQSPDGKPLTKDIFQKLDKDGAIIRNLISPPMKDTVTVPNRGYTIVRMKPVQIGAWMLECKSCGLSSLPAAVVITASQPLPKSIIDNLPKCGSFRPPDVLLN